eukprot:sb/3478583/
MVCPTTGETLNNSMSTEVWGLTQTSKQPIRSRYLGHVTGYQPIRDHYFLIRSVPGGCWVINCYLRSGFHGLEESCHLYHCAGKRKGDHHLPPAARARKQ